MIAVAEARPVAPETSHRLRWLFWASTGLIATFAVLLALRPVGSYSTPIDGWGVDVFELTLAVVCAARFFERTWQSSPRVARVLPLVLGGACLSWAGGDVAHTILSFGGATVSVPSVADAFYIGFFPLCFLAFMLVIRRGNGGSLAATALDGLIGGLAAASLCAAFAFQAVLRITSAGPLSTATTLAYPVGDVLLFALAIGGFAILPKEYRRFLVVAAVGLATLTVGDAFNLLQPSSRMGYVTNAVVWPIAFLLLAIAIWGQPANARIRTVNAQHLNAEKSAGFVLPVLGALASGAVLIGATVGHPGRPAIGIATATLVVVGLRLALIIREGQTLRSARFRSLIDNLWDLIVVTEADFRIAYTTSSSARVLGCPPADLLDTAVIDLVHPNDRDLFATRVGELSGETDTVSFETRVRHRNGMWRTMAWTATNQLDDPSVRGYVLNGTDVTEARLGAEELATARDTAVEATRLKSEFLASMSHEIRTPMNAVIGLTELLLDTNLDREQLEYASGVGTAAAGLLAIINDILDFSKIEAGKLELEIVDFEPALLLEDVAGLLGEAAQRTGLELLAHALPGLPGVVRGDPTRLRQVLVNLVTNAVKFTAEGEVVLRAVPVSGDGYRAVVRFEVSDTGIGIAAEDQQRMFEPFSQADASTTRRFGGTGLGLAIVRQLVELMGGHLGLVSEIDRGSTFWFELPFDLGAGLALDPDPVLPELGNLRAIVVDDNATNRLILRQQLSSWGIHPDEADNASSALTRMKEVAAEGLPYDLAILDLNMPDMDGLDLARALKSDPATATAKLFLLSSSGRVSRDVVRDAELAGTLAKPVRQSELFNCLIEGLHMNRPGASAAPKPTDNLSGRGVVLLVEDNAMNRLVATRMLAKLGYRVDVAVDGREAITAINVENYDAVLMDCQMPEMDGYEATRHLRDAEAGTGRHLPIIAMTAAAMQGDRDKCIEAGMDDYITKPVTVGAINVVLDRWIAPPPSPVTPAGGDAAAASTSALDPERFGVLRELDAGDGELLEMIAQEFLHDANEVLGALRDAIAEGDPQRVERAGHTLRGASANVGATRMADLSRKLEALGKAAALGTAPELLEEAVAELIQVEAALRAELASAS